MGQAIIKYKGIVAKKARLPLTVKVGLQLSYDNLIINKFPAVKYCLRKFFGIFQEFSQTNIRQWVFQ